MVWDEEKFCTHEHDTIPTIYWKQNRRYEIDFYFMAIEVIRGNFNGFMLKYTNTCAHHGVSISANTHTANVNICG